MCNDEMLAAALEILRDAHKGGPQAFNRDEAQREIELVRRACDAHEQAQAMLGKPADRREDFSAAARALRKVQRILAPDARAVELHSDRRILEQLPILEETLKGRSDKSRKKRGEHGGAVPPHMIDLLSLVYRNATEREPTTTAQGRKGGAFHQFACSCIEAFGYSLSDDRVLALIKAARKRPAAQ